MDVRDTELNERALKEYISLCSKTGADSQIVVYKGKIVSEWYSSRYKEPVGAIMHILWNLEKLDSCEKEVVYESFIDCRCPDRIDR